MKPQITLRRALADPNLLGRTLAGHSWAAWRTLLIAAMGEELTASEREIFKQVTGRDDEPNARVEELAIVAGRRGGKSRALSTLACYLAALTDYRDALAPGERGVCILLAPDQRQAAIDLSYCAATFEQSPILKQLVVNQISDTLELSNGVSIEVRAASHRRLRGPTYLAVLMDEAAFFYSDDFYQNTDTEVLNAVRPGLATTRGPVIIASSPYARKGVLWSLYKHHYGSKGDPRILVAQAPSRILNPSLPQSIVDRALERDRAAASAEFLAMFRADIESFVRIEVVEACTGDYVELPAEQQHQYYAFVDPSGGSSDSFTLAIAHREGKRVVIDAMREVQPPFSPERVVEDFANLLKGYRGTLVRGDKYGGEFPRELFRKHGIAYRTAEKSKSDLYRDVLPLLNSGNIVLPRSDRLVAQLVGLERRTTRAGRDTIDHAPNSHDDLANAVAGAADAVAHHGRASPPRFGSYASGYIKLFDEKPNSNIANPQSPPCTINFPEEKQIDERHFKIIRSPRIW
jgi:hypothetical protein